MPSEITRIKHLHKTNEKRNRLYMRHAIGETYGFRWVEYKYVTYVCVVSLRIAIHSIP